MTAIESANLEMISRLAGEVRNINEPVDGYYCLERAVALTCAKRLPRPAVEVLLRAGANSNLSGHGTLPIQVAAIAGDSETVRLLLRFGASANGRGPNGETLLHYVAMYGDAALLEDLIVQRALDPHACTSQAKLTPLHVAAAHGSSAQLEALAAHGVDMNVRDVRGFTPLMLAVEYGQGTVVDYLLRNGADITIEAEGPPTAAHLAAEVDNWEALRIMSHDSHFLSTAIIRNARGQNAMHLTAESASTKGVECMEADIGKYQFPSVSGRTPLHAAARFGNTGAVSRMLDLGYDDHCTDSLGFTARDYVGRTSLDVHAGNPAVETVSGTTRPCIWITLDDTGVPPQSAVFALWPDGCGFLADAQAQRLRLFELLDRDAAALVQDLSDCGMHTSCVIPPSMHSHATIIGVETGVRATVWAWDGQFRIAGKSTEPVTLPSPRFTHAWSRLWGRLTQQLGAITLATTPDPNVQQYRGVAGCWHSLK
jgi:ankyrin repeat protein